ncbi:nuclear transport factor 2 family protein [Chloroflexota bacterium]
MFTAFGQGDIPTVLGMLSDDVDWQTPATRTKPAEISWARPRRGHEQVAQFFQEFAGKVHPEPFEQMVFTAQGDRVIVEGRNRGTVKSTGRSYEHDWVMIFVLHGGKIAKYRQYYDTADVLVAFQSK